VFAIAKALQTTDFAPNSRCLFTPISYIDKMSTHRICVVRLVSDSRHIQLDYVRGLLSQNTGDRQFGAASCVNLLN